MRYVPSIPPPVSPFDNEAVKPVAQTSSVRPVTAPSAPPIVFTHYRRLGDVGREVPVVEEVGERRSYSDRRYVCRRIDKERDKFLLLDSRAEWERRRNSRRHADLRTNIDEEI